MSGNLRPDHRYRICNVVVCEDVNDKSELKCSNVDERTTSRIVVGFWAYICLWIVIFGLKINQCLVASDRKCAVHLLFHVVDDLFDSFIRHPYKTQQDKRHQYDARRKEKYSGRKNRNSANVREPKDGWTNDLRAAENVLSTVSITRF